MLLRETQQATMNQNNHISPDHDSSQNIDAQLQREIDQALDGKSIDQIMEEVKETASSQIESSEPDTGSNGKGPKEFHHELRRGRITAIRGEDVFVDMAGESSKLQGLVPLGQFDRPPRLGSIMEFVVDHIDENEGLVYLSREGAISRTTWEQLQRGAIVEARVIATNKGGLDMEMVGGIRAFMPASQIDIHHVRDLEEFIGQKLEGIVQEIDRRSKKVVLSRRQRLEQQKAAAQEKLLEELEVGQIREGTVSSIVEFGAFVDLGGVDGLVHVSDISYTHVDKPHDVVKVGQSLKVKVLKIDTEKHRISLGLKQVEPDPWQLVCERLKVGDQVTGRVVRTASFGAFVEIEPGVEGLLPISEMSWTRISRVDQILKDGDVIRLAVLNIDIKKRRISLSLKQAQGDPWVGAEHKYEKNSLIDGKVIGTTDFGAFVELEPGIEGLVHISELADHRIKNVQDILKVGDQKQFRILEIDEEQRKVRLSLKAVAEPAPSQVDEKSASHSSTAKKRQPRTDLKSGLGDVGSIGLGDLNLDHLNLK